MKKLISLISIPVFMFSLAGCGKTQTNVVKAPAKKITISAAASLSKALGEIQKKFEKKENIKLSFNFESSGTLQKQIEQGAPADAFISAGKKQMDALEKENLIDKDSRKDLLGNKLVLIVSSEYKDKIKTPEDLLKYDVKLAMGEPKSVPAGDYGTQALTSLKLSDKLKSKVVYGNNVEQVVTWVEQGTAAAGIVYKSDAANIKTSSIAYDFDESTHKPIIYPEAIVTASKEKASAKKFLHYLSSSEAKKIFEKYGFEVK